MAGMLLLGYPLTFFNSRRVQTNLPGMGSGAYPFLNAFKQAGTWSNITGGATSDRSTADANGYLGTLPGGGVRANFQYPSSTDVSGNWVAKWDGNGSISWTTVATETISGGVTAGNPTILNAASHHFFSGQQTLIAGLSAGTMATLLNNNTYTVTLIDATHISINVDSTGKTGGGTAGTASYGSLVSSTGSGRVEFAPAGSSSPRTATFNIVSQTSPPITNIRVCALSDETDLDAGSVFRTHFKDTVKVFGALRDLDWRATNVNTSVLWADRKPVGYYSYSTTQVVASKIATSVAYDGTSKYSGTVAAIGALADKIWCHVTFPNAQTNFPSTLNINSYGDIPLALIYGQTRTSGQGVPANKLCYCVYDADINVWMVDDSNGGIQNGVPPELTVQLCNEVGAHLWCVASYLQVENTDFTTQYATYCKANLRQGLKVFFEGTNETWNNSFYSTQYSYNKRTVPNGGTSAYTITAVTPGTTTVVTLGTNTIQVGGVLSFASVGGITGINSNSWAVVSKPSPTQIEINATTTGVYTSGGTATPFLFDVHNWYGQAVSKIGQAASAVFGGDTTKYGVICGFQQVGGVSPLTSIVGISARLTAPGYVAAGGTPASQWCTHICSATYFHSALQSASATNYNLLETRLAYEYPTANPTRQTAIIDQYANGCNIGLSPINITGVTKGATTVLTVDSIDLLKVNVTNETLVVSGVVGTTQLNGNTYTVLSKTPTTVTINVNSTGFTNYVSGGVITPQSTFSVLAAVQAYTTAFLTYCTTFSLGFMGYEGGYSPDFPTADTTGTITGLTNGATTNIIIGPNAWDYIYNTLGLSGYTTTIAGIAAGTLATLLNSNAYTILSADASSITINVDTSAVSSWVSGGSASYVGSQTLMTTLREASKFSTAIRAMTTLNYTELAALSASVTFPSEYGFSGVTAFGMLDPDEFATSQRYLGVLDYS